MNGKKNVSVQILDPLLYYLKLVHCLQPSYAISLQKRRKEKKVDTQKQDAHFHSSH